MEEEEETACVIPEELQEEILHWLPSNDLLRCKAVCKKWRRLISKRRFIQKHLERSTSGCNGARFLTATSAIYRDPEIIDLENDNVTKKISLGNVKSILGSCDGLVLCQLGDCRIAAANPSTGRYVVRTPNPSIHNDCERRRVCSWFGHHPGTGEYVLVLAVVFSTRRIVFNVYGLSCSRQNPILSSSTDPLRCALSCAAGWDRYRNIGTFLHGRLHCPIGLKTGNGSSLGIFVLVHSFEANRKIEKIWCPVKANPTLGVVDGCLSVVGIGIGSKGYGVWVMKEYGNEASWTKLAKIEGCRITCDNILSIVLPLDSRWESSYAVFPIMKYGFGNKKAEIKRALTYGYICITCIDSLVSPDSLVFRGKGYRRKNNI